MARFTQNVGGTGSALNYVQVAGTPVPVTGYPTVIASLTITTTGKPVQISVTGDGTNTQANTWVKLNLFRDEQPIGNPIQIEASAISENVPYAINFIDDVAAGEHLYQAVITDMSVGTWTFGELSGPVINAVELTGFKGDTGLRGLQGEQGIQGETGPQGPTGPMGPAGDGGGPKEWTSPAEGLYQILQAHGGVEVQTESEQFWSESAIVTESNLGSNTMNISVTTELNAILLDIINGVKHFRSLSLDINGQRFFRINYQVSENVWNISLEAGVVTVQANNGYWLELRYDGAPVVWWDIATLGLLPEGDEWKFRGAKIDYHAYSTDSGTMIGTIYMARDAGDNYLTHIETGSGGNDLGSVSLWYRGNGSNETSLQMYRQDGESSTTRIHWTAQVYVGTEFWND